MPQVMQPRVRDDSGHFAHPEPERVKSMFGQRFVSVLGGEHPLPGRRASEGVQQLPRRLAEQNVPRSGLGVDQSQPVGLDFAPAQAAYLTRPASGQQDEPHRRDADGAFRFATAQDRAELREVVRAEQPPARRSPVADNAGARVPLELPRFSGQFRAVVLSPEVGDRRWT